LLLHISWKASPYLKSLEISVLFGVYTVDAALDYVILWCRMDQICVLKYSKVPPFVNIWLTLLLRISIICGQLNIAWRIWRLCLESWYSVTASYALRVWTQATASMSTSLWRTLNHLNHLIFTILINSRQTSGFSKVGAIIKYNIMHLPVLINSTQLSTQPEITDAGVWHLYVRIIINKTIL